MAEPVVPTASGLENRLEFETVISDTSAALYAAAADQLDQVIERALERVRTFFRADRCALLTVSDDQQVVNVRVGSYADGVQRVSPEVNLAPMFPWSRQTLFVERAPVRISRISELPADAAAEREAWRQMSISSALTLPIEIGGKLRHLIVLNTVNREVEWPDAYVTRLRVFGELLAGALDRQAMVDELREAEERAYLAADSAEAGLWTLDFQTGSFWLTDRDRTIFGFAPGETVDLARVMATIHPDDRDRVRSIIDRAKSVTETLEVDYRIIRPGEGDVRWITSRGRVQLAADGEPEHLTGVSIDITDQRRNQDESRRNELRLVSGADLAGLAFYEVDFESSEAFFDDRIRELCGVPSDMASGFQPLEHWLRQLHPRDRQRVLDSREQLHSGKIDRMSLEYRFLHPVDGVRWIQHLAGASRRDAAGRAVATFGVLRDVSAQKQAEDDLRELSRRLIRAHEEERALLARELHDDVTQRLAVLAIDVGRAERATADRAQAEAMQTVREGIARLSEDIHTLAYQLHPSVLEELGLVEALQTECERMGRKANIPIDEELEPLPVGIGKDAALCLFRVAQEALNNLARHASARTAGVTLRPLRGGVMLAVRDDGVGFDPVRRQIRRSLGLASMRERVRLVNGTFDVKSAPGDGTSITAWVPLEGEPP